MTCIESILHSAGGNSTRGYDFHEIDRKLDVIMRSKAK
jgi:hypothetical protein